MRKIIIWEHVKPLETVWTGIPGIYGTAPEQDGTYRFVEYASEWNNHIKFAFEREGHNKDE